MNMFQKMKVAVLSVLVVGFLASCQNGNDQVREEARNAVENNAVQPDNQTAAQPAAQQAAAVPSGPTTTMEFSETEFDFGTVVDGEKVAHTYKFKNTGSEPLILSNAQGSCGCTVPKWPREPIAPGAEGEIVVEFNSKNKKGKRNQKVTITANTNPPQSFLYLKGEVLGGEGEQPTLTQ